MRAALALALVCAGYVAGRLDATPLPPWALALVVGAVVALCAAGALACVAALRAERALALDLYASSHRMARAVEGALAHAYVLVPPPAERTQPRDRSN